MQGWDLRQASDIHTYYFSSIISVYLEKYLSYLLMLGQSEKTADLEEMLIGKTTKLVTETVDHRKSKTVN